MEGTTIAWREERGQSEENTMRRINREMTLGAIAMATLFLVSGLGGMAYQGTFLTEATLYAGQDIDVGTVTVSEDSDYIYVLFEITADDWYITETHVDIQTAASGFELTNSNNPKVGKFAYSDEHDYVDTVEYAIDKDDLPDVSGDFVVAAHAVVAHNDDELIDFEEFEEFDFVDTVETDCGDVDFYMTSSNGLVGLEVGDYAALTPSGLYPEIAEPDTHTSTTDFADIVAFTVGSPVGGVYVDDKVVSDPDNTGAGGMVLTDPQDTSGSSPLQYHAYTQYQAIVIDLSSLENVQSAYLAGIDPDWHEIWHFLYFDGDNELIYENVWGPVGDQSMDGYAFPIDYDAPGIEKIVIYVTNNIGQRGRAGYALDNIVLNCVDDMETAWGDGTGFGGSSWATYIEVDRD
jgi:hypothetical protein